MTQWIMVDLRVNEFSTQRRGLKRVDGGKRDPISIDVGGDKEGRRGEERVDG